MNIIYNGRYGYAQRSDEALRVGNRRRTRPGGRKLEEILQGSSRTNKNKLRKGREKNSKIYGHQKYPRTMAQSQQHFYLGVERANCCTPLCFNLSCVFLDSFVSFFGLGVFSHLLLVCVGGLDCSVFFITALILIGLMALENCGSLPPSTCFARVPWGKDRKTTR